MGSREKFEYKAGKILCLPTSIIELARNGDGYDHAFDSNNIMQPLNSWWRWWNAGIESVEVELPPLTSEQNEAINECDDDDKRNRLLKKW